MKGLNSVPFILLSKPKLVFVENTGGRLNILLGKIERLWTFTDSLTGSEGFILIGGGIFLFGA